MNFKQNIHKFIFLFGLFLSFVLFYILSQNEAKIRYKNFVNDSKLQLEKFVEVILHEEQYLVSLKSFYQSSTHVDAKEFQVYVNGILFKNDVNQFLDLKVSSINYVVWCPVITHSQRNALSENIKDLPENFSIKAFAGNELPKDFHLPILYQTPIKRQMIGLDIKTVKKLENTIKKVIHKGELAIYPGSIYENVDEVTHLILSYPLYDKEKLSISDQRRIGSLKGIFLADISIKKVITNAFGDEKKVLPMKVTYQDKEILIEGKEHFALNQKSKYSAEFEIGGETMYFEFSMPEYYRTNEGNQIPLLVTSIIVILTLMSVVIIKQNNQMIIKVNKKVEESTSSLYKAQGLLEESNERFDLAIKGSASGIWDWDVKKNSVFYSTRFKHLLGYEDNEFPNVFDSWAQTLHPDDSDNVMQAIDKHLKENVPYQIEYRCKHKNGQYKWFLAKGEAIFSDGEPTRMAGSIDDISEQKNLENELVEAKDVAESANETKSRFLSQISHELRTPLNSIIGFSQILKKNKELPTDVQEYISIMNFSGKHLLELINEVLDLTKLEAKRMSLITENFEIRVILSEILDLFMMACKEKGLDLQLFVEDNVPKYIHADVKHLRQIIINLIGNAVKFTKSGHIALKVQGEDASEKGSFQLTMIIEDSGIGISKEDQAEIFKPFQQSLNKRQDGTGLGLSISNQLVSLMGGQLNLESALGKGSTFSFKINVKKADEAEIGSHIQIESNVKGILSGKKLKILIVDDIESNRLLVKTLLDPLGFETMEAFNGQQALNVCSHELPDLILMDICMPVMDGNEATVSLKKSYGDKIKIYSMTASINNIEDDLETDYFDGHVDKPVIESLLLDKIATDFSIEYSYDETQSEQEEVPEDVGIKESADWINSLAEKSRDSLIENIEMQDYDSLMNDLAKLEVDDSNKHILEKIKTQSERKNISFFIKLEEELIQE